MKRNVKRDIADFAFDVTGAETKVELWISLVATSCFSVVSGYYLLPVLLNSVVFLAHIVLIVVQSMFLVIGLFGPFAAVYCILGSVCGGRKT